MNLTIMKQFRPSVGQCETGNMIKKFVCLNPQLSSWMLRTSMLGSLLVAGFTQANLAVAQTPECTMTLNNSDIDFGQLNRNLLTRTQQRVSLGQRTLNLSVKCDTPTDMTLFYRAAANINQPGYIFGAGGHYQLNLRDVTLDGQQVTLGHVSASGQLPANSESSLAWEGDQGITMIRDGKPMNGSHLHATIDVSASAQESQLKLRNATEWQGSGRLELAPGGESRSLNLRARTLPVSCVPMLSHGGTVKLGKISHRDLSVNESKKLQSRNIQLSVACEAPVSFALKTIDNQLGTAARSGNEQFGLGNDSSANPIGSYTLSIDSASSQADSHADLYLTQAPLSASSWSEAVSGRMALSKDSLSGFTTRAGSNTGPSPIEQLNTLLTVDVEIAPTRALNVSDEIEIKGSATIEVFYI